MKYFQSLHKWLLPFLFFEMLLAGVMAQNSRKPGLIRDTDIAEGKDSAEAAPVKEPNPALAEKNISIGNYYFQKKNYSAAIQRYLEALEYQKDSIPAYESLSRAYEKNGDITKAIQALKTLIEKQPDSPKSSQFRLRLTQLEKKSH